MPIVELSKVSKEIAKGNYKIRVNIKNRKDEIGMLGANFNIMIQATEGNIKELENLNDSKQRFIDSLTHELKTPLTSIIGYSDLLLKGNVNDEIRFKSLSYINSEAVRLEKLSLALLKLILIKQEELTISEVSLKASISIACKTLSYKIESKKIRLKIKVKDLIIKGDIQLIVVLLINFLDNALKSSKEEDIIEIIGEYSNECDEVCSLYNIKLEINSIINHGTTIILKFCKENSLS